MPTLLGSSLVIWRLMVFGVTVVATLALAAASSATARSGLRVPGTSWFWGNPTPQGGSLFTVDFAGEHGFAAGGPDRFLASDDGGNTWVSRPGRGGGSELAYRLQTLEANSAVMSLSCKLERTDDGGRTFTVLGLNLCDRDEPTALHDLLPPQALTGFDFPSPQIGYAISAEGLLYATTDGGGTFTRRGLIPGTEAALGHREQIPSAIQFLDATSGYVATGTWGGVNDHGTILSTSDGGKTWTQVADFGVDLTDLAFVGDTGYAIGDGPALFRSDGGQIWTQQPLLGLPPETRNMRSIDCISSSSCVMTAHGGNYLLHTDDAGLTVRATLFASDSLTDAAYVTPSRAVAVGFSGVTVSSDDGGDSWARIGTSLPRGYYKASYGPVRASSPALATASGRPDGSLAITRTGGRRWSLESLPTTFKVLDASFAGPKLGYAIDGRGRVFRTNDSGQTWDRPPGGSLGGSPSRILAVGPRNVVVVGSSGVQISADGGRRFTTVRDPNVRAMKLAGVDRAGNAVVAYGGRRLVRSTDMGQSWERLELPFPAQPAVGRAIVADFVSEKVGYVLQRYDYADALWKTIDGGGHWRFLPGLGPVDAKAISFPTRRDGFVSGQLAFGAGSISAGIWRTSDGGASFQPQPVGGLVSAAGSTAFINSSDGDFLWTRNGGTFGIPTALTLRQGPASFDKRRMRAVTMIGRLQPANGGERIFVSFESREWPDWDWGVTRTDSQGRFSIRMPVLRNRARIRPEHPVLPLWFVAHWGGNRYLAGSGSQPVAVEQIREP